jgi:hypothetical protein
MNLHQEFHDHLQAGRIAAAISLVVSQLVELKITTKASSGSLNTTVDLLSGQITSVIDPAFVSDKASQKLLEFHTNQITATAHVVKEQLRSLQDLLQVLAPSTPAVNDSSTSVSQAPLKPAVEPLSPAPLTEIISSQQVSETLPVAFPEILSSAKEPILEAPEPVKPVVPIVESFEPQSSAVAKPPEASVAGEWPEPLIAALPEIQLVQPVTPELHEQPVVFPEIPKPESRAAIASGLAAAIAQTSAFDPAEAASIPNKFDQALKSAGVRPEAEDLHPFVPTNPIGDNVTVKPLSEKPTDIIQDKELIDLLSESDEDWDEWLLEEDNILSELSDVTKEKLPDLEASWLSDTTNEISAPSRSPMAEVADAELGHQSFGRFDGTRSVTDSKVSPAEWEEFMPECADLNTISGKNQANVERFRQNLVNDPQLMSELLAELDDLEQFGEGQPKT